MGEVYAQVKVLTILYACETGLLGVGWPLDNESEKPERKHVR